MHNKEDKLACPATWHSLFAHLFDMLLIFMCTALPQNTRYAGHAHMRHVLHHATAELTATMSSRASATARKTTQQCCNEE